MEKQEFMRRAIQLSLESVKHGGGPFGAVIVKEGKIIAEAANRVTLDNDPTAHAEVNAIRQAARSLGRFDLSGCDIYTSCEPCPMCLGAIYWAHLEYCCPMSRSLLSECGRKRKTKEDTNHHSSFRLARPMRINH